MKRAANRRRRPDRLWTSAGPRGEVIDLLHDPVASTYALRRPGAPTLIFGQPPYSPDDPWTLTIEASGPTEGARVDPTRATVAALEGRPDLLPPGAYVVAETSLRPAPSRSMLLGNERVAAPPGVIPRLLREDGPVTAHVLTLEGGTEPCPHVPLVGLAFPGLNGREDDLVYFVPLRDACDECLGLEEDGDLALIVPRSGALVHADLWGFDRGDPRDLDRWRDRTALDLARWLVNPEWRPDPLARPRPW